MKPDLLQLPADLVGLEVLHHSISLLVKVSDVLPKTVDCHLPLVWVRGHSPCVAAWCENTWIFRLHSSTLKTTFIRERLITYQQRAPERQSELQPSWLSGGQIYSCELNTERLEYVEQIPCVITQRKNVAVPRLTWGVLRLLLAPWSAHAVFYSVSVAALACVRVWRACMCVGGWGWWWWELSAEVPVFRHATVPPNRVPSSSRPKFFLFRNPFIPFRSCLKKKKT